MTKALFRLSLVALLILPFAVNAATGLTIQPIKVSQTLDKGAQVSGFILLSNASANDVRVELKVEDFIPTSGEETIQFVGRAPGITTVRDWITINNGETSFLFKKGEQREIPYTITAPPDAEPGSHFGVMFFKATDLTEDDAQIKVGTQVGVLVFITVPGNFQQKGEIRSFTAPSFSQKGPIPFELSFENTGTVHFEPKGSIKITNMFGKEVGMVPIEGQVVLPTGIKNLKFEWAPDGLLLGRYAAVASVSDGEGKLLTSQKAVFYVIPVWYILAFLLLLIIVFFIIKMIKSRVKISVSLK